jgi:hypothetical protein
LQVAQSIAIVEEAGQAVVAALHHVLRDAGQVEAGRRAVSGSMPAWAAGRSPYNPVRSLRYRREAV